MASTGALQYADVIPVQAGHFRKFLLGKRLRKPKLPQALPKELSLLLNTHESTGRIGGDAVRFHEPRLKALRKIFDELDDYSKEMLCSMARGKSVYPRC
jgi:hypothetical protein